MTRRADLPRILSPRLTHRTRARLWAASQVDRLCGWLCRTRSGTHAAMWVWRACRMW